MHRTPGFDEITLTLENDANFYRAYLAFETARSRGQTIRSYSQFLFKY